MADQVTEHAQAQVDRMLNQARNHCAQLLSESRGTAKDTVNSPIRVETMVEHARTTA
ncbi:MAG: hypothetical protein M3186_03650 [Actinomycetota bacterium]|nr:hypothetical protein [Actinomycetota bacterium]